MEFFNHYDAAGQQIKNYLNSHLIMGVQTWPK